eukprot:8605963-Prorocentrum_lima.AAC.1
MKVSGEANGWDPGHRPSFGAGSHNEVDSLKVRKKLPDQDFGTSRLETLPPAKIRISGRSLSIGSNR